MKPITIAEDKATELLANLRREYDAGVEHRRPRLKQWQKNDDRVNGSVKAPKRSMNNFHLPILSGFEDTLVAKVDEQPQLKFGSDQPGEKRLGRKYDELYRQASSRPGREWKMADLSSKRDAARYGRAMLKLVGSSKPFGVEMISVDPYDFYIDPLCGDKASRARYLGIDFIFKSSWQLQQGVKDGAYDANAVKELIDGPKRLDYGTDQGVKLSEAMTESMSRFSSLKLDGYGYLGVGEKSYRIVESGTTYEGVRYYCVWSPEANVLLRCQPLKEVYGIPEGKELWHVVSWAPFPDKKVFWSKAPDDDVSDVSEFQRQTMMYAADGLLKGVWGSRTYDPAVYEPQDLVYLPGGLAPSKKGASQMGSGLAGGIHEMRAPDYSQAFSLIRNLDAFVGQKAGITPDAQGQSNEDVLGIAQQNIEQVSDRMGLTSKQYQACYVEVGQLFLYLAKKTLKGKEAVSLIGPDGYEFESLSAREIDPAISVTVRSGRAEEAMSTLKRRDKTAALNDVAARPDLPKWWVEERLRLAGYEDSEVRTLTDEERHASTDQVDRANEAVEEILEGKEAKVYQGADTSFVKTVIDAAKRYTDSDGREFDRLMAYAKAHVAVVGQNMAEQLVREQMAGMAEPQAPPPEQPIQPIINQAGANQPIATPMA